MWADRDYLGFVEAIEPGLAAETAEGPHGEALPPNWEIHSGFTRLRMSGVSHPEFEEMMARVTPLEGPGRTPEERGRRLGELREVLRPERLPLIDIHLPSWVQLTDEVLRIARLGAWYSFSVKTEREGFMAPVFFGDPEQGTIARSFLARFEDAPERLAARLRDIFSLAHVGDFGDDDGTGAPPIAPPPEPLDDGHIRIFRVPWTAKEPVDREQSVARPYRLPSTQLEEQQVRIKL